MADVPPFYRGPALEDAKGMDWSSEYGAKTLAQRIEHLWRKAGYANVQAKVERLYRRSEPNKDDRFIWCVRTNLVNGLPPRG